MTHDFYKALKEQIYTYKVKFNKSVVICMLLSHMSFAPHSLEKFTCEKPITQLRKYV